MAPVEAQGVVRIRPPYDEATNDVVIVAMIL